MNIPVALIALVLIAVSKPKTEYRRAPIDYRGAVLIASGIGLSIFGLQQSALWGWSNPATWVCIVAGLLIIAVFVLVELRTESPLIKVSIFRIRPFAVENIVLLISMMAFIPIFFFASEYAQIALHKTASQAGIFLLFFFLGFVVAAQIGGRILDREGAKRAVVLGCAIAAVGFGLWASKATTLNFGKQQLWVIVSGAGMGMMLGPANTDAVNRASNLSYGEATGITQTIRNYGASLGLAALGTILLFNFRSHLTTSLQQIGDPNAAADADGPPNLTVAGRCPPSRTTSRWTLPTPPRRCSTSSAASWRWPGSSPCSVSSGAARRSRPRKNRQRSCSPRPDDPAARHARAAAARRRVHLRRRPRSVTSRSACASHCAAHVRRQNGAGSRVGLLVVAARAGGGGARAAASSTRSRRRSTTSRATRRRSTPSPRMSIRRAGPFEATYTTTGSSPATVVYATDPDNDGCLPHHPDRRECLEHPVHREFLRQLPVQPERVLVVVQQVGQGRRGRPEEHLRLLHAVHWVNFLKGVSLVAGLAGDKVTQSTMSLNGFDMSCVDLVAHGVPGTSSICTTQQNILGYVKVAQDSTSFADHELLGVALVLAVPAAAGGHGHAGHDALHADHGAA